LHISRPFNLMRRILFFVMTVAILFCLLFMQEFFSITRLSLEAGLLLVIFMLATYPVMAGFRRGLDLLAGWIGKRRKEA